MVAALAACLLLAVAAIAAEAGQGTQSLVLGKNPAVSGKSVAGGMRVFIDPKTGHLKEPTPAEAEELQAPHTLPAPEAAATAAAPVDIAGPGGAVSIMLDESFMIHSVARINPDGAITTECVTGIDNAVKLLNREPGSASVAGKGEHHEK